MVAFDLANIPLTGAAIVVCIVVVISAMRTTKIHATMRMSNR